MRPLIRWTMGNVSEAGWECLSESTRLLPKIYPECDFVICYNSLHQESLQKTKNIDRCLFREKKLKEERIKRLRSFGIDLYEQKEEAIDIPHVLDRPEKVSNHCWKLCPVRLRPESHELWIDNDIIIIDRIPEIDEWLKKDVCTISTTYGGEQYGRFELDIENGLACCAGLFGVPPHFDLKEKILKTCNGIPLQGFDEQGAVVSIVTSNEGWIPISVGSFAKTGWWENFEGPWRKENLKNYGYHFIRLNTGSNSSWEKYKMLSSPDPKIHNSKTWKYNHSHIIKKGTTIQRRLVAP